MSNETYIIAFDMKFTEEFNIQAKSRNEAILKAFIKLIKKLSLKSFHIYTQKL